MIVLPLRRRTSAALAVGALLLAGVSACGSSDDTSAHDPGASTSAVNDAPPTAAPSGLDTSPVTAATASGSTSDGAAPSSVSIDSPGDGTQVTETLTVSGTANSPEANVPWEIDSPIDGVVVSGAATADGWLDKAYPWKTTVDVSALQPGRYTFTARVDDDSNKEGKNPPAATITFTKK